jgi:hypothetical protein
MVFRHCHRIFFAGAVFHWDAGLLSPVNVPPWRTHLPLWRILWNRPFSTGDMADRQYGRDSSIQEQNDAQTMVSIADRYDVYGVHFHNAG